VAGLTHISDQMRAAVGRSTGPRVSFPVSESDIRRWAIAVYYPDPPPREFIDADAAARSRHGGFVAPEEFNPFAWMVAVDNQSSDTTVNDPDRTERMLGVAGPGLRYQLNGGQEVEYGEPIRPGDVVTEVSRLASYHEKEGRLGLMLFTITELTWTNQRNEFVKLTRQSLIRY